MFTPKVRLALAVTSFFVGAYWIIEGSLLGLAFVAAAALLGYGYFKYGTVWLAFREVARGNMDQAVKLLNRVSRPDALRSEDRAYFEMGWGLVCASRAQNELAESHLQRALGERLRTSSDRALAEAVLAQLLLARGEREQARGLVVSALTRNCRPAIAARLQAMQQELSDAT